MARHPFPKGILIINGKPATPDETKKLEEKFAKMHLTPPYDIKKKKNKKKTKTKEVDEFAAAGLVLHDSTKGSRSAIPYMLYVYVKEAAEIMKRPEWPNDKHLAADLEVTENRIAVLSRVLRTYLPAGWKYERECAISLIAGYETVITRDEDMTV